MICTILLISEKKDAKQKRPSTNDKSFLLIWFLLGCLLYLVATFRWDR